MEFKKNQILEVEITDMSENGEGIGKVLGYTLFVKDAVIGDKVKARLTKVKKNYSYARVEEIVCPSKHRIEAPCPISRQCGGCQIQALDYKEQLKFKEAKVKNDLVRLGDFDENFIERISEPIVGMDEPFRYRNKAQYPVATYNGRVITGFYAGRTHSIIENDDCLIGCEENKEILKAVVSYMEKEGVPAYDETTGTGVVRHVLIRKGFTTGEIMVCLVVNLMNIKNKLEGYGKKNLNGLENVDALVDVLSKIEGVTSVSININNKNTNVIMGEKCVTLWGDDAITDYIGDIKFKISPLSFFQVNPVQTKKLYEKALKYADLKGDEIVWDLYCGIGTVSLFLARSAKKVYGVEIVEQAILDARENAKINGIENVEFITGAAEDVVVDNDNDEKILINDKPDVIVVDPPRKGCDKALLDAILKLQPSKIVYISCNPSTLARDLKYLTQPGNDNFISNNDYNINNKNQADSSNYIINSNTNEANTNNQETKTYGYVLQKFCPHDLFPQTVHVETAALLEALVI